MRRRLFLAAVMTVGLFVTATSARANTVTLNDWTTGDFATNTPDGGGPFKATTTGTLLGNIDFVTFCIEYNEHFGYGGTYNFALSNAAIAGGVAGGNPDPVSDATKWLYTQATTGDYTSFYQTATGNAPNAGTGAVFQEAIWFLEEERTSGQISAAANSLASYALANQNWASLYAGGARVYAMNLTALDGSRAQDQLAYARVPDSGTTFWLLAMGLGLIHWGSSRLKERRPSR